MKQTLLIIVAGILIGLAVVLLFGKDSQEVSVYFYNQKVDRNWTGQYIETNITNCYAIEGDGLPDDFPAKICINVTHSDEYYFEYRVDE